MPLPFLRQVDRLPSFRDGLRALIRGSIATAERGLRTLPWRGQVATLDWTRARMAHPRYRTRALVVHLIAILAWMALGGVLGVLWIYSSLIGEQPETSAVVNALEIAGALATMAALIVLRAALDRALGPWEESSPTPGTRLDHWIIDTLTDPRFEDQRAAARGKDLDQRIPAPAATPATPKRPRL